MLMRNETCNSAWERKGANERYGDFEHKTVFGLVCLTVLICWHFQHVTTSTWLYIYICGRKALLRLGSSRSEQTDCPRPQKANFISNNWKGLTVHSCITAWKTCLNPKSGVTNLLNLKATSWVLSHTERSTTSLQSPDITCSQAFAIN